MIETVEFNGELFPKFQSEGFAAQYAFPFAKKVCKGHGLDIGCNREEWKLEGAIGIDPLITLDFDAYRLPEGEYDYIFSSHCLEHLPDWVGALDLWISKLKQGGVLFLYLPHACQSYWLPWNNRKHLHVLEPHILQRYMIERGMTNVFVTGADLNYSFYVVAEKI